MSQSERHDRALLLLGAKRNVVLTLEEVQRYGADSFADPDYVRIYGMTPADWYARGVRLLGRTTVECTRDVLADRIGQDIAALAARRTAPAPVTVIDPFAGSCNTLYWILGHVPQSVGIGCELDAQVHALTQANLARLGRPITLFEGDYDTMLSWLDIPSGQDIIAFVAPPWGTALDETRGLDLRRTTPPITTVVRRLYAAYPAHRIIVAIQVYERIDPDSLAELQDDLAWSELHLYGLNAPGQNHGILLGTMGWLP